MDLLKERRYNVEIPRLTKSKYGKTEVILGSSSLLVFYILSIGMLLKGPCLVLVIE